MYYKNTVKAQFLSRPNRFIAKVLLNGKEETVHVKNTGRCKELLIPGCTVFLCPANNPSRKTKYDLIAVLKKRGSVSPLLINMDSQIPNYAAEEWLKSCGLFSNNAAIRREVTYKNSRFDLYVEDGSEKAFIEVKGVTLENNGIAKFPDAPTERGIKHITELVDASKNGYKAYILFVIQMKEITEFRPNDETHQAFGEALRYAANNGVDILAVDCIVTENSIEIDKPIKVCL